MDARNQTDQASEYNTATHHIDPSMVTVVYLIVPNDRVTPCANLHPCKCVAMDIVVLQNTTPTAKEVHSSLEA